MGIRRAAGVIALALLVGCTGLNPAPSPAGPASSGSGSTSLQSPVPTTGFTSPVLTGPTTSGSGPSVACARLDRLDAALTATLPDYNEVARAGRAIVRISATLDDPGQAALLASIGSDAQHAAAAFLNGDLAKGARLQNRVVDTIPPARVALGCD